MSSRIYTHMWGIFFDYRRKTTLFKNEYFNDEDWKLEENWFVFLQFNKKWFEVDDVYYDGHTANAITILGLRIGRGYSWDSNPLLTSFADQLANTNWGDHDN